MRSFQQPKAIDSAVPDRTGISAKANSGQVRNMNSILKLQRTIGNQAVQRMLEQNGAIQKFDGQGSRTPVSGLHAPGVMDARGGGSASPEETEDERAASIIQRTNGGGAAAAPPAAPAAPAAARPTPTNVRNGPRHAPIDSGDRAGMSIAITISSSSGTDADMAGIQDSEQVGLSYNHTGSISGMAALASSQSGFMAGHPIPDDQHAWSKTAIIDRADNHGGNGSFEKQQLDIYTDSAAGVTTPVAIPNSGYIIKREIIKNGTAITFRTSKRAGAANVNGYTSQAGPSATQSDDVAVRA
ncbi:MAG: hypothetical protein JXA42_11365 [Anaerolineales bacterium]|nr:hypothetical protein [Anaerolineales bacterium]